MKIAFLIVCHDDAAHIARLARRLTLDQPDAGVFVHVDRKSPRRREIKDALGRLRGVHVLDNEVDVWWGGSTQIDATHLLLRASLQHDDYQRFMLLQGADYPLKPNGYIHDFFAAHEAVEFIRASNVTTTRTRHHSKSRYVVFHDRLNLAKKIANKLTRILDVRLRDGKVTAGGESWDLYWGCAQWALTRHCVEHLLSVSEDTRLRRQFDSIFPAEDMYFHTVVFNSPFRAATSHGEEPDAPRLVALRNLHYFEYPPGHVKILTANDYEHLRALPDLFIRKVRTQDSSGLLDLLDADNR